MADKIYDLITVGGGPAGLICALAGVTGIPINPPRHFSGLVLDKFSTGEFAKYGKLRVTNKWYFMGHKIMSYLISEAKQSNLTLAENEKVIHTELKREIKTVETEKNIYKARKICLCPGFFPHGNLVKYRKNIRVMFSPIGMEAEFIPKEKEYKIVILGGNEKSLNMAKGLKNLRPDLKCIAIIESPLSGSLEEYKDLEIYSGSLKVNEEKEEGLNITLINSDGKEDKKLDVRFMLIDYNSYTLKTDSTDFLKDSGIDLRQGYIKVDENGNTGLEGVVAAGNITTPVSGVITALSTGFTAGLNIYNQLHKETFGKNPVNFPWLPFEGLKNHPLYK